MTDLSKYAEHILNNVHNNRLIVFRKVSVGGVVVVYRILRQTQGEVAAKQILDRLNWNYHLSISCQKINCSGLQYPVNKPS